jgi:toxin-antitoxin system PIN domain toxin
VIAVDTNVLVYAHRRDHELHGAAASCVRAAAEGREPWAIPWPCIHEFLAIVTHPRIFDPPSTLEAALVQVDAWLESPTLLLLAERPQHWRHVRRLVEAGEVRGVRVHDARVAAICLSHGVSELWTVDRDFGRFPQLRTSNPLVA